MEITASRAHFVLRQIRADLLSASEREAIDLLGKYIETGQGPEKSSRFDSIGGVIDYLNSISVFGNYNIARPNGF